jgi:hypothetical protein
VDYLGDRPPLSRLWASKQGNSLSPGLKMTCSFPIGIIGEPLGNILFICFAILSKTKNMPHMTGTFKSNVFYCLPCLDHLPIPTVIFLKEYYCTLPPKNKHTTSSPDESGKSWKNMGNHGACSFRRSGALPQLFKTWVRNWQYVNLA